MLWIISIPLWLIIAYCHLWGNSRKPFFSLFSKVASSLEIDNLKKHIEELLPCSVIYGQAEDDVHETEVTLLMFNR